MSKVIYSFVTMVILLASQAFINFAQGAEEAVEVVEQKQDLEQLAEQTLIKLINVATDTGEFIKDQVPLVIKELLVYNTITYSIILGICVALLLASIWLGIIFHHESDGFVWVGVSAFNGILTLPFGIFEGLFPLIKIMTAPRVWLIEYAANLVR